MPYKVKEIVNPERERLRQEGARIRAARLARGESLQAAAARLGMTPIAYCRLECGVKPPA